MGLLYVPVCSYSCVFCVLHVCRLSCTSMCATHHIRRLVCVHVLGTSTPPNLQRYVCVRTVGNVCKSKVCYHPHPTHPPTQPKGMCVCVQLGMYASPRSTHPTQRCVCVCVCAYSWECMQVQGMLPSPPHPPTHPTQSYVCVCAYSWEDMQVQGMLPSPPHPPTHPPNPKVCVCAYSWECMQVQGMLPSPPHPPTRPTQRYVCVCVQLGMYASPRYVTIPTPPTHPPNPKVCVCVRTVGNVCKSKVCYHPHPTHPPTQPKGMCVCVRTVGNVCKSKVCYHPQPTHPPTHPTKVCVCVRTIGNVCKSKVCYHPHPTHPPTQPKGMCVCVCVQLGMYASPRYVTIPTPPTHPPPTQPKGMCVQMSPQKHVVCTDESDLCAQMRLLECVYRWVKSVCADESPTYKTGMRVLFCFKNLTHEVFLVFLFFPYFSEMRIRHDSPFTLRPAYEQRLQMLRLFVDQYLYRKKLGRKLGNPSWLVAVSWLA